MNFIECTEEKMDKIVPVSEKGMKFIISNAGKVRIRKVIVDGCLIDDERERCDYLFEIYKPSSLVLYVELKGCGIKKACSQLEATLGYCQSRHAGMKRRCYIVASRVPKALPGVQVLKKRFVTRHGVQLIVKTRNANVCV